jgi:hypothetical protein
MRPLSTASGVISAELDAIWTAVPSSIRNRRPSRFGGGQGLLQYGSGPCQLSKTSSDPLPTTSPTGSRLQNPDRQRPLTQRGFGVSTVAAETP